MGNPIGNPTFARDEQGTWHSLHSQVENVVSAWYNEESSSFDPSLVHGVANFALLILWPNDILPESIEVSGIGILVAIYEESGVKYVKRLSTASTTHLDRARDREIISRLDNGLPWTGELKSLSSCRFRKWLGQDNLLGENKSSAGVVYRLKEYDNRLLPDTDPSVTHFASIAGPLLLFLLFSLA